MTDNTQLPAANGGDTLRTVARPSGVKTEVVGLDVGGPENPNNPSVNEQMVSDGYPMPVNDPYTRVSAQLQGQAAAAMAASAGGAGFYPQELPSFFVGAQ